MQYSYDYFLQAFEEAKITADHLITDLDDQILVTRPNEDKWCIGEILSHLNQAGNEYLSQIKNGLNIPNDKLPKGHGPFTPNFLLRWFIRQVSPDNKRPLPTFKPFLPLKKAEIDKRKVLSSFTVLQDEFIKTLQEAKINQLDLDAIKTRNPIVKFVPMSITACLGVTEAHQRRHFDQIKNLREQLLL